MLAVWYQTTKEIRYYISSLATSDSAMNAAIRGHWGIENSLHWRLDMIFGEDESRRRKGNSAENFSVINRIALNLLKQK